MTLPTFLHARIAEDERRIAAECEAKRRILRQYEAALVASAEETDTEEGWVKDGVEGALLIAVQNLASPYAHHEDYREEWAPLETGV